MRQAGLDAVRTRPHVKRLSTVKSSSPPAGGDPGPPTAGVLSPPLYPPSTGLGGQSPLWSGSRCVRRRAPPSVVPLPPRSVPPMRMQFAAYLAAACAHAPNPVELLCSARACVGSLHVSK